MFNDFKTFGVTSVGERGQIVIPSEIREKMDLKKGDKLFVFVRNQNFVGMIKANEISKHLKDMLTKLENEKMTSR